MIPEMTLYGLHSQGLFCLITTKLAAGKVYNEWKTKMTMTTMTNNDIDLPVLDQGGGEEDGGLSSGLHTDLVDHAGVLAGQTVGGEE